MYKIRCFGIAKDITDQEVVACEEDINYVSDLRSWLNTNYPAFDSLASYMIAVNEEYALENQQLQLGDTIAIIPPVSGG